jgi:hypothetical protein
MAKETWPHGSTPLKKNEKKKKKPFSSSFPLLIQPIFWIFVVGQESEIKSVFFKEQEKGLFFLFFIFSPGSQVFFPGS